MIDKSVAGTSSPILKFCAAVELQVHPQDLIRQVAVFRSMLIA